ncbi:MAG: hypothetical protein JSS55_14290 [Proteobacteria bacterium]|nr:hypothetical protein [Pseudomonadota bacterium]
MVRFGALALALATSLTLLGSAAIAQPAGGYYNITLAEPAATKTVVHDMVVNCDGANCSANQGTSRPAIVCASVARQLGPVTAFRAGDTVLDGEALAKCNAKADTAKIARR